MTVVNPKSISGINSITTGSGSDNLLTIHTSDASSTERVRINSSGDVIVGSGITVSPDGDIFATGVTTSTTFSGSGASLTNLPAANLTGTLPAISGANLTSLPAANLTGTLPAISGANLTSLPAQATISNNSDNRVITGGSGVNLNGEAGLTYDGSDLNISNNVPQLILTDTNSNNSYGRVRGNGGNLILSADVNNATADSIINFEIDGSEQARIKANGDIGLSNSTPTAWGSGIPTVEFKGTGNTSRGGAIAFESYSGSNGYNVIYSDAGDLRIYCGATNRASASEKVMFPRTGGITFNGDTSTSNALDDYEEGNFTPTVNGIASATYTVQAGRYTKIGNLVTAQAYLLMASGGGLGSAFSIGSLPFTSTNTTYKEGGGSIIYENGFFDNSSSVSPKNTCTVWVPANNTIIQFHKRYNGASIFGNDTSFGTGANNVYLIVQVCYVAA